MTGLLYVAADCGFCDGLNICSCVPSVSSVVDAARHDAIQSVCYCLLQFFPGHKHLDYALTVEDYTLQKAANLVLNVDGCIAALFLDLLYSSGCFTQKEMDEIISVGYLNGLFVLARSIGLIGHALDQKRLQQPLYRHPWEVRTWE